MNEQSIRPTKKQRELLTYIEQFIGQHGYSPSYREIMNGLDYTSVATVSLHINSLIRRGHLRKRDRSARSLEVVNPTGPMAGLTTAETSKRPAEEQWLVEQIEQFFKTVESAADVPTAALEELHVLVGSLQILGMDQAVQDFAPRLTRLQARAV